MVPVSPARPELVGVTRRQLFNRTAVGFVGLGLSGFAGAVLAFLWPREPVAFGSRMTVGPLVDILARVQDEHRPVYVPAGRFYLVPHESSVLALYQKCTHMGCRVPFCQSSQWFECGCHVSSYNLAGELKEGPATRGLDRFPVDLDGGRVVVNTGLVIPGPPAGTDTIHQDPAGPHCVGP